MLQRNVTDEVSVWKKHELVDESTMRVVEESCYFSAIAAPV